MIISLEKLDYMNARVLILEAIEIALKHGFIDHAKALGESSQKLAEKIQNCGQPLKEPKNVLQSNHGKEDS